jgi:hypothetical protein
VVDDFAREGDNKGRGTATLKTVEAFDAGATQWLAFGQARIWRDRVIGDGGAFSGGTIWAQGWLDDPERRNDGGIQYVIYRLHNVWWLMEQHFYQQPRKVITGISGSPPVATLTNVFTPEVYLGEAVLEGEMGGHTTVMQSNGAEIAEILNWVNECFNPTKRGASVGRNNGQDVLAVGTIEPRLFIGIKRAASMLCSEAIIDVLRLQPDSIVWVDESTAPPTVNVRTLSKWNYGTVPPTFIDYTNLPEVVIDITAAQERRILAQGQTMKNLPAVVIWWCGTNVYGSQSVPFLYLDDYPGGTSLVDGTLIPNDGYTPRASVHFVVLEGAQVTLETATVSTEPLAALMAGGSSEQVAWWRTHDLTLGDPLVDPATIVVGPASVLDNNGYAIDTALYPNILVDSHLPRWASSIGLNWVHATIRAEVGFTRYADAAHKVVGVKPRIRTIHKRVKLTNAVTGQIQAATSITPGEVIPVGVAESVWRSTNAPQWAGSIEFVGAQLRSDISFGNRYRLVGPHTTFYNVLPQRIVERPCSGVTEMIYGPAPQASIDALLELTRATRFRMNWRLPSGRATGRDAGQAQVDTGGDAPTDDTAHSPGGNEFESVTYPDTV